MRKKTTRRRMLPRRGWRIEARSISGLKEDSTMDGEADFEEVELLELSRRLDPLECLRLVEEIYRRARIAEEYKGKRRTGDVDLGDARTSHGNCLVLLEEWNNDFPGEKNRTGRWIMETTLKSMGRPDLARYLRRNAKTNRFDNDVYTDYDEPAYPVHEVFRRHAPTNDRHPKMRKRKRGQQLARRNSNCHNEHVQRGVVISAAKARAYEHTDDNQDDEAYGVTKTDHFKASRWITVGIVSALLIIIVCALIVLVLRRRHCGRRCPRLNDEPSMHLGDKTTCINHRAWEQYSGRGACTCPDLDLESGWSRSSSLAPRSPRSYDGAKSRSYSENSSGTSGCLMKRRKKKRKKKKKKKRRELRLLRERNSQAQRKDRESNERKEIEARKINLRDIPGRISHILRGSRATCKCCKCAFHNAGAIEDNLVPSAPVDAPKDTRGKRMRHKKVRKKKSRTMRGERRSSRERRASKVQDGHRIIISHRPATHKYQASYVNSDYARQRVDVDRLSDTFGEKTADFQAPKLEQRVSYGDFFENFSNVTRGLINEVIVELYRQARLQSILLGNAILSVNDELRYEIESVAEGLTDNYLESILEKLNHRLEMFLSLNPGSMHTEQEPFKEFQDKKKIRSYVAYHPIKDLFTNLGVIVDTHLSNINVLINIFYKRGWVEARKTYSVLQNEFRDEFLNGFLLKTCGNVVTNVFNQSALLEKHVDTCTWDKFKTLGTQIKTLYEELVPVTNSSNETTDQTFDVYYVAK
ncbi:hypothetical protein KM043_017109 [Ampulex compressa]|nr:hypothetical protein KM043_017109 [Ampulex compressa]